MKIVRPQVEHLPSYISVLERGWSPDNVRGEAAAREELESIRQNPGDFLTRMVDREPGGALLTLPDGTKVPRLPSYRYWLWDGEFCGVIGFRWQPGTSELPPYVLGHIGYGVVPWKRGLGYATEALRQMLLIVREERIPYVDLTTDPSNLPSRRVIECNGGVLMGEFTKPEAFGGKQALRFRIQLQSP